MKNNKGVTLIALVITIIVLLILTAVATYSGIDVINSSKITAFTTRMKIMQTQVNSIYEKYVNGETIIVDNKQCKGDEILNIESSVTDEVTAKKNAIFNKLSSDSEAKIYIEDKDNYKYWNDDLIKKLGIEGVKNDSFFVNIKKRSIVSYSGIEYEGKKYYTLNQLPDNLYNVEYENENNEKPSFNVNIKQQGKDVWKVEVTDIKYEGYIDNWKMQYKLGNESSWKTSDELSFFTNTKGNYNIKIFNGNVESTIKNDVNVQNTQEYNSQHPEEHIPTGYIYKEGTIDTGYVITDSKTKDGIGNEFVWIPVESENSYYKKLGRINYYVKSKSTGIDGIENLNNDINNAIKGDILAGSSNINVLGKTFTGTLEKNMPEKELVIKAGGFWVGRYEAGIENVKREESTNINWESKNASDIIVKQGVEPVRGISQEKALEFANNWGSGNGNEETKTVSWHSGLITGAQWDAICNYIGWDKVDNANITWGNFRNLSSKTYENVWHSNKGDFSWINSNAYAKAENVEVIFPTGTFANANNVKAVQRNIYDIAGNIWEWTTEVPYYQLDGDANGINNRVIRGIGVNSLNSTYLVTGRHGDRTKDSLHYCVGFRIMLYVQ